MSKEELPSVSIIVPTYNSMRVLHQCLESIRNQEYPQEKVELIIADGGSNDNTLEITKNFKVDKILSNPLRTGEAGKAVGLNAAKNDIVVFIDSDNRLPCNNWLRKIVQPFEDERVVGSEPIEWEYRTCDPLIDRYAALCGDNDPIGFYTGTRAHWSWSRLNWTDIPSLNVEEVEDYFITKLPKNRRLPSIGANGFAGRRILLKKMSCKRYYFDVDVVYNLVQNGYDTFAIVKVGIIHLHVIGITDFIRKAYRRIRDFLVFKKYRVSPPPSSKDLIYFLSSALTLFPLVKESVNGYRAKPDVAWFFHPMACYLVGFVYAIVSAKNFSKMQAKSS
jgi:glycosyltransferase involved in cell wall biosynthesis